MWSTFSVEWNSFDRSGKYTWFRSDHHLDTFIGLWKETNESLNNNMWFQNDGIITLISLFYAQIYIYILLLCVDSKQTYDLHSSFSIEYTMFRFTKSPTSAKITYHVTWNRDFLKLIFLLISEITWPMGFKSRLKKMLPWVLKIKSYKMN